jgi:hypothetical protein
VETFIWSDLRSLTSKSVTILGERDVSGWPSLSLIGLMPSLPWPSTVWLLNGPCRAGTLGLLRGPGTTRSPLHGLCWVVSLMGLSCLSGPKHDHLEIQKPTHFVHKSEIQHIIIHEYSYNLRNEHIIIHEYSYNLRNEHIIIPSPIRNEHILQCNAISDFSTTGDSDHEGTTGESRRGE